MTSARRDMDFDVVVVGGGPVGILLAAEIVLGGAWAVVIERDIAVGETIKAGSINLASAEILARRGLIEGARAVQARAMKKMLDAATDGAATSGSQGVPARPDGSGLVRRVARRTPRAVHFAAIMLDGDLLDADDPDVAQHGEELDGTFIPQREVQRLLDQHASRLGVPVRRGVTALELSELDGGVEVVTDQGTLRAGWVVGCDGGRSFVRRAAEFDFPGTDPEITGRQATVTFTDDSQDMLEFGWHWSERGVWRLAPGGVIATVEFDAPPTDRSSPVTIGELEDSLRRTTGMQVSISGLRGQATRWTDNARQATTYRKGRVLLAGDAAHVHSPFSGQGLNLGLGDATNLGWKLAATVNGWAPDGLLDTYTTERHPLGAWVLDWTRAQVALMRPDEKTGRLRDVVSAMFATPAGLTHVTNLISGITQRVEILGEHELIGRLTPDITTAGGRSIREQFASGRFVLLDRTPEGRFATAAADWNQRMTVVTDSLRSETLQGLLARPDGVVVWATNSDSADLEGLPAALTDWAGPPQHTG